MYHEKQRRKLCLLHTLNCLLQREHFTQQHLDAICYSLDERRWFNPHKSWLMLGDYDANVLIAALGECSLEVLWFDNRLPLERIRWEALKGLIVNIPSRSMIPFMNGRHWLAVLRKDDGSFVNMDSKLNAPEVVPSIEEFCRNRLSKKEDDVQILLVSTTGVKPLHSIEETEGNETQKGTRSLNRVLENGS